MWGKPGVGQYTILFSVSVGIGIMPGQLLCPAYFRTIILQTRLWVDIPQITREKLAKEWSYSPISYKNVVKGLWWVKSKFCHKTRLFTQSKPCNKPGYSSPILKMLLLWQDLHCDYLCLVYQLSIINYQLSIINYQLSIINC